MLYNYDLKYMIRTWWLVNNGHHVIVNGPLKEINQWCQDNAKLPWAHVYDPRAKFRDVNFANEIIRRAQKGTWDVKRVPDVIPEGVDPTLFSATWRIRQIVDNHIADEIAHSFIYPADSHYEFYFADGDDAMLFKLTWA